MSNHCTELNKIVSPQSIFTLSKPQIKELQKSLDLLNYNTGPIDSIIGPLTQNSWSQFKKDHFQSDPTLIGPGSISILLHLLNSKIHDFSSLSSTIQAIKWECKSQDIGTDFQIAYILATTQWETAGTFKPVREAFWKSENWRKSHLRYYPYYGRGFVQLTWLSNYLYYSKILGIDLVNNPDLAMDPNVSLFILVHGFKTGSFTGKKITDFNNFVDARQCINGFDKAHTIANIALSYLS